MKFAVLMTCFNRVETTLDSLRHLYAARLRDDCSLDVWLNDDGCTDGTSDRVEAEFPQVHIIKGSGHDYWCGGMRSVWREAASNFDYDGYIWLNDDTIVNNDAISIIMECPHKDNAILVGATCSPTSRNTTYSGWDIKWSKVLPDGTWKSVHTINGNFVWVPKSVYAKLGNFREYFTHALGDLDYGLRAFESNIPIYLAPRHIGVCEANTQKTLWMGSDLSLVARLKNLYSPKGGPEPYVFFKFNFNHFGLFHAIRIFAQQHIHVCFPSLWR